MLHLYQKDLQIIASPTNYKQIFYHFKNIESILSKKNLFLNNFSSKLCNNRKELSQNRKLNV